MRYVRARANEFLLLGRRGRLRNLGTAAGAWLWPGSVVVRVPSTKQEACFALTQESRDGIPLRFKGLVLYRVVEPVAAATTFDFASGPGDGGIGRVVEHVALGELRDLVSHLTMQQCIEERKATLSEAVGAALRTVASGAGEGRAGAWGIELELVQVAQVYVVDGELRGKLEAELRSEVGARSERAHLEAAERVEVARLASRRRVAVEQLESARESNRCARETAQLEQQLALERLEGEAPVRRLAIETDRAMAALEVEAGRVRTEARALEVERELLLERARHALEREMLPLRQVPQVAEALGQMFRGANLSIHGADQAWTATVAPLVDLLARRLAPATAERTS